MTAIGFFMFVIGLLMVFLDESLFKGETPSWYSLIGVIMFYGGGLGVFAGIAAVLWRVMP
jgi:hypothetical protein